MKVYNAYVDIKVKNKTQAVNRQSIYPTTILLLLLFNNYNHHHLCFTLIGKAQKQRKIKGGNQVKSEFS